MFPILAKRKKRTPAQLALPGVHVLECYLFCRDVGRLWTLGGIDQLKLNGLTFLKIFEAVPRDARVMHKHVGAAFLLNEPKTLFRIEPLHFTRCHSFSIRLSSFSPDMANRRSKNFKTAVHFQRLRGQYRKSVSLVNAGVGAGSAPVKRLFLKRVFVADSGGYVAKSRTFEKEIHFQYSRALGSHDCR
jgi:hypothetical protein